MIVYNFFMESKSTQEKQGLINKRRHKKDRELKRLNVRLEAEFTKKRERIFEKQEMELESMPEISEREEIKYLEEADYDQSEAAYDARDGLVEFRNLANGGGHFTFKEDDGYSDTYTDPIMEELEQIEAEEQREREQARRINQFNDSKPVKSGAQKVRKLS